MARPQISKTRFLIQLVDSGRYLSRLEHGEAIWSEEIAEAMTYCHQETADRNLDALGTYYSLPGQCTVVEQTFYAQPSRPSVWSSTPLDD